MSFSPVVRTLSAVGPGHVVLGELVRRGPSSRTALAARLGLSAASLTRLATPLVAGGVLRETAGAVGEGGGRPARPLEVVPEALTLVGVAVTGSSVTAVRTGLDLVVLDRAEQDLGGTSPAEVAAAVIAQVAAVAPPETGGPDLVGVSLGGWVEDGVVRRAPFLGWTEPVDLVAALACLEAPVVLDNDLVALTRGEHWCGVGRDLDRFAVLTVGAGVGFGTVVHDQVVDGPDAGLGLFAHVPVGVTGISCARGHEGCASAVLATSELTAALLAAGCASYDEGLDRAAAGDPDARAVVDVAGAALGRLAGTLANVLLTPHVLLTGEGARLAEVAADAVTAGVAQLREPAAEPLALTVRPGDFADYARGAAVSALQEALRLRGARARR